MSDISETKYSLNDKIALFAAILSACLAITSIQASNISDQQRDARLAAMDQWNQYQAKRMRQSLLEANLSQVVALRSMDSGPALDRAIVDWQTDIARYDKELEDIAEQGKAYEAAAKVADDRGSLFSRAEMILTLALTLFAITALTRVTWLFNAATLLGLAGILYSTAGWSAADWTKLLP